MAKMKFLDVKTSEGKTIVEIICSRCNDSVFIQWNQETGKVHGVNCVYYHEIDKSLICNKSTDDPKGPCIQFSRKFQNQYDINDDNIGNIK